MVDSRLAQRISGCRMGRSDASFTGKRTRTARGTLFVDPDKLYRIFRGCAGERLATHGACAGRQRDRYPT